MASSSIERKEASGISKEGKKNEKKGKEKKR